jgi:hypothetical protein
MNKSVNVKHVIHTHTHMCTQHSTQPGAFHEKYSCRYVKTDGLHNFQSVFVVTTHISIVTIFSVLCAVTICCLNVDCHCCVRLKKTRVYVTSSFHKMVVNHGMERMLKEAGGVIWSISVSDCWVVVRGGEGLLMGVGRERCFSSLHSHLLRL